MTLPEPEKQAECGVPHSDLALVCRKSGSLKNADAGMSTMRLRKIGMTEMQKPGAGRVFVEEG